MRRSFAYSTIWMGEIAAETADGRLLVDIATFLARDDMNIAQSLREQENGDYRLVPELSVADTNFVRVFPRNIELEGAADLRQQPTRTRGRQHRPRSPAMPASSSAIR